MKITKIELDKGFGKITVWTDVFPDLGFGFDIDELSGKEDLKKKLKLRIQGELDRINTEKDLEDRFQDVKSLEGSSF